MKNKLLTKWTLLLFVVLFGLNTYAANDNDDDSSDTNDCANAGSGAGNNCIHFYLSTGPMRNQVNVPSGVIGFLSDTPSPTHSTPQALKVVTGLYGILRVVEDEVDVLDRKGNKITFVFPNGSAIASPADLFSTWHASLKLVDAQGIPTTNNPVYYDLYTFDGLERVRFYAETNSPNYLRMVELRTDEGQVYQADEFGMSYIYDEAGSIRQVLAPTRMMDFVIINPTKYEVHFYEPQDVAMGTNGLYAVLSTNVMPFETWTVENPDGAVAYNRLNISRTVGGTVRTTAFNYIAAQKMWSSTEDDGLTFEQTTVTWDASRINGVRSKAWLSAGEAPVAKWTKYLKNYPWGQAIVAYEEYVSATNSQIATYGYYTNNLEHGRYKRVSSRQNGDGIWAVYDYDSLGRQKLKISSWKDVAMTTNPASAKAVYSSYTPNEAADVLLTFDERPRTETERTEGVLTKKTFYTYKTNSVGAQIHITEECVHPSALYGNTNNLRTVKTFYPPYEGENFQDRLNQGRIKTIQHPDGKLETYEYALGTLSMNTSDPSASTFTASTDGLDWQVTVIHGTVDHPEGIANQTVKEVTVTDKYRNTALRETYVYTGSGYERINWIAGQFDVYGHALNTWYSDGTQKSGFWGTGCCGKDSRTDWQGVKTTYTYDLNKRRISAVKLTTNDTAGVTQDYTYDAQGRRLSTVRSATGIAPLTNSVSYDMLGRKLQEVAEDGTVTQRLYDDETKTVTETLPGGATRITTKYADGQMKSIAGTAVVAETFEYGVNSNGTQWQKKYTGPNGTNSPLWEKTSRDVKGRITQIEKPGFGTGVILVTKNRYDYKGRITKTEQVIGSSIQTIQLVEYNELGELSRKGMDVNKNGVLVLASMDQIEDHSVAYIKENGDWFEQRLQVLYPQNNSSTALTNFIVKTRLTGLGTQSAFGNLQSEILLSDRFGNESVQRNYIDRAARLLVQVTDDSTSTQDAVRVFVNGLLTQITDNSSQITTYSYDALDRPVAQRQVSGGIRTVGSISHYNVKGQIDWQEDGATNRTWFAYDSATGRKVVETNALGHSTTTTYNDRGQVTAVGGSSQYPVEYGYDEFGRMTDLYTIRHVTNGWDRTQWIYDQATGVLTNKLYDDGKGPSYTYTGDLKLKTRKWARDITTTFSYDTLGQLTNTVYSDGTPSVAIAYNRLGQKAKIIDASGTNTFWYNGALLLTNEVTRVSSFEFQVSRSYDNFGRPAGINLGADYAVSYSFDELGRFSSVTSSVSSATSAVDYSYLPGSSLLSGYTVTTPQDPDFEFQVSNSYEPNRNNKTSITNSVSVSSVSSVVSSFGYTYDALNRRTQRTDLRPLDLGLSTNSFAYNARSELTSAQMSTNGYSYNYDSIGNRIQASGVGGQVTGYLANGLNQYLQITNNGSQVALSYDLDGNLTNDSVNAYTWDGENRLVKVEPLIATNGSLMVQFAYDAQGRRISKKVYEWSSQVSSFELQVSLVFVYDNWNLIQEIELNPQSEIVNRKFFTWGLDLSGTLQGAGGVGGLLSQTVLTGSTPSTFFTTYDANGNIAEYIDSTGTVAAHFEYDPYGNTTSETISTALTGLTSSTFSHRFSTKYLDSETNLYYYGYRYYSPELGRWLNWDPSREAAGLNLYDFLDNNPLDYADYLGLVHWGNWTGKGWGNGEKRPEAGGAPYPDPDDPDYKPPTSPTDACSEAHDRCINACPQCPQQALRDCTADKCDAEMATCLAKAGNYLLSGWFSAYIPGLHRSGIVEP